MANDYAYALSLQDGVFKGRLDNMLPLKPEYQLRHIFEQNPPVRVHFQERARYEGEEEDFLTYDLGDIEGAFRLISIRTYDETVLVEGSFGGSSSYRGRLVYLELANGDRIFPDEHRPRLQLLR